MDVGEAVWIACRLAHLCEGFKFVSRCKTSLLCCTLNKVKGTTGGQQKHDKLNECTEVRPIDEPFQWSLMYEVFPLLLTGLSVFSLHVFALVWKHKKDTYFSAKISFPQLFLLIVFCCYELLLSLNDKWLNFYWMALVQLLCKCKGCRLPQW